MDPTKLESGLSEAGLTQYEIQAYTTLLDLGSAPATDLAERADIPRSRIYDVLRDLEEEGYVETYEQDSLRVRAREPTDVFERLKSKAETLEQTAEAIQERYQRADVNGHRISFVKRVDTVFERATAAIQDADNQVELSVTPGQFDDLQPVLQEAYEDDVFVSVSLNTSPERPTPLPTEEQLEGVVSEARHRDIPAPLLIMVDREITCFAPHMETVDKYGVIFEDLELTYVFRWYFKAALWESWPVVYTAHAEELPAEYVDIRECIRDVVPFVADDAEITVSVRGRDTETGESRHVSGIISDLIYANGVRNPEPDSYLTLTNLAGRAAIVVDTGEEEVTIGGWGASLEDVEAQRIVVESVSFPETA